MIRGPSELLRTNGSYSLYRERSDRCHVCEEHAGKGAFVLETHCSSEAATESYLRLCHELAKGDRP